VPYRGAPPRAPLIGSAFALSSEDPQMAAPMSAAKSAALSSRLAELLEAHGGPAFDAALYRPGVGLWSNRVGLTSQIPPLPLQAQTAFWWASVGKTLTAALVLQCVAEGKLSLQDKLALWFPDFPQARFISIESLLDHTNGTLTYNHADAAVAAHKDRYRTPAELLATPILRGNLTCPGLLFGYTNTGYLLLALVLEAVLGQPLHNSVEQRITAALALSNLRALSPGQNPIGLAAPHINGLPQPVEGLASLIGAGNIVASAHDMLCFWHALLGGRLVPQPLVRNQFARLLPMNEAGLWYGHGVMVFDFRDRSGAERLWLGHSGGAEGSNALVLFEPARAVFAAVAVNGGTSAAAVALALIDVLTLGE
jgi:D-alanyl-D-alanine carboxypeptidase